MMLSSMRANKRNQTVIWVVLALLAIGLIGFGGLGVGGGTIRTIGSVGDEKISVQDYARGVNNTISAFSQNLGRRLSATEAESMGIQASVLQNLLSNAAIDDETAKLGISVGDSAVQDQLLATPVFHGLDGTFDKDTYERALERSGISAAEYDNTLRKESARSIVQTAIVSGLKSQGTQANTLLAFDRETRNFTWAELTTDALDAPLPTPTDAELTAQYEATPEKYTAPLTREITYAWLSPDMLSDQVTIDEEQIKESYDLQVDRFQKPERRSVERLVFASQDDATKARNDLDAGTVTFDTLLADRKLEIKDVDLGDIEKTALSKQAAEIVFAAAEPGIVGPAESDLGPALYRINAILAEQNTNLEDARAEIVGELAGESARRLVGDLMLDIDELLAGGAEVEDLAKDTDMQLGQISLSTDTNDGIAAYENFRTIANETAVSDFPVIHELADGGIFALDVKEIKQPTLKPFADVKDQVTSDWTLAETQKRLEKKAQNLIANIEGAAGFGDLPTKVETNLRRSGYVENTPPELLINMFETEIGKVSIIKGPQDSVFIAKLDAINAYDPDLAENVDISATITQQLDAQIANDILASFADSIREDAGVALNQAAINQVNSQLISGY